jgi:hypothetical protein
MLATHAAVTESSVTRSLALAVRAIGSVERLAEYLGVTEALLKEWLEGRLEPPTATYVRALDLAAGMSPGSQLRVASSRLSASG